MGTALIAIINRQDRTIELDPAVRVGTTLSNLGEAVLLHTTSMGHCQETAAHVARALRQNGWTVTIRPFDELQPLREVIEAGPGMMPKGEAERLCALLEQRAAAAIPRGGHAHRYICRDCFHQTSGYWRASHTKNLGHDQFDKVRLDRIEAYLKHVRAHGQAPDSAGEVWMAPGAPTT